MRTLELLFSEEEAARFAEESLTIDIAELVRATVCEERFDTLREAEQFFLELHARGIPCQASNRDGQRETLDEFEQDEESWYDNTGPISLGMYQAHSDYFLPYEFHRRLHQLEAVHREFGIPLPAIPGKQQKEQRARFYLNVNAAWQEFRALHGLSPSEMRAFLYDFASELVPATSTADLPAPAKVWMVTGGSWDIEVADTAEPTAVFGWGANAAVRRGDILVVYLVRPLGAIHSIWRACSDGFIDPVSHYHSIAWIGAALRVANVSLNELRAHPVFGSKSAVRANFQGLHGKVPLSFEEYEALLAAMAAKGQDLSALPRLAAAVGLPAVDLLSERDVEVQLVEPLLERLGYASGDWVRQMPVRMGRGERNYPDYAIGAVALRGEESARMVVRPNSS